jgi:hypothetical protein
MSTYLNLCKSLRTECGVSGTDTTVASGSAEWLRMVGWIAQAWIEIQEKQPDWEWMRKNVTFNTQATKGEYTAAEAGVTDLGTWKGDSFRLYLQSAGVGTEQRIGFKDYNTYRNYYLLSTRKTTYARPSEITISPSRTLMLGLIPNDIYVVSGEYWSSPITLAADADTPAMPSQFHSAIVYRAMMHYGAYEAASDVYERGEKNFKEMMAALRNHQLPSMSMGQSLI